MHKIVNGKRVELSPEEEAETCAKWEANKKKASDNAWYNDRINEYPKIEDQLDMLWHELDVYGTIEKEGPWYKAIKAVKDKNPKPE